MFLSPIDILTDFDDCKEVGENDDEDASRGCDRTSVNRHPSIHFIARAGTRIRSPEHFRIIRHVSALSARGRESFELGADSREAVYLPASLARVSPT